MEEKTWVHQTPMGSIMVNKNMGSKYKKRYGRKRDIMDYIMWKERVPA